MHNEKYLKIGLLCQSLVEGDVGHNYLMLLIKVGLEIYVVSSVANFYLPFYALY
jgi:hypothetical protein